LGAPTSGFILAHANNCIHELDTYERKLHKPSHEKCQQLLGSDIYTSGKRIVKILPGAPKDATQHHGQDITSVESLDTEPDNTDHSSNKDKEV
jgi:hypothetical protein